jgi:hypothetical protein
MSEFLEQLKVRLVEAQRRHAAATLKLQAAQQEHAAATQDFASWQNAVRTESIREQHETQQASGTNPTTGQAPVAASTAIVPAGIPPQAPSPVNREEINKTDAIRQILRQHPEGLRPTDLWKHLGSQLKHRAYLYSVLKRLKDKSEVSERRGKYFLKVVPKIEEDERVHGLVQ